MMELFQCEICQKEFNTKRALISHRVGAHNPNARKGLIYGRRAKSQETKRKISIAHKKLWTGVEFKEKALNIMRDPKRTDKIGKHTSKRNKQMWQNDKYRQRMCQKASIRMKEKWQDENYREKQSLVIREAEKIISAESREKIKITSKSRWLNSDYRNKMVAYSREQWNNPSYKEYMKGILRDYNKKPEIKERKRQEMKQRWQNELYVKDIMEKLHAKPNNAEIAFENMLNDISPGQWRFVGNGKLVINGKVPDYVHINNKLLIELFGDYWHRGQNPQDRIDEFEKFSYKTLVIWESEFKNDIIGIKNRILAFVSQYSMSTPLHTSQTILSP